MVTPLGQLSKFIEEWFPGLSEQIKDSLIKTFFVGVDLNPATSVWTGDGYLASLKFLLQSISVMDYNRNILFKEYFFEDKEWIQEMTDGLELIEALKVQVAAFVEAQKQAAAGSKPKK